MIGHKDVSLKPLEDEHVSMLVKWGNLRGLLRNRANKKKTCTTEQKKLIRESGKEEGFSFIVAYGSSNKGVCEIYDIDWINRNCNLNFYFEDRAETVPACGEHALIAALDFIFDHIGMHKVSTNVLLDDVVMVGLYKSNAFQVEARKRQHHFSNGSFNTVLAMSLLEGEFEVIR